MSIAFEHPYAFFFLILLIPLWVVSFLRSAKLAKLFPASVSAKTVSEPVKVLKNFKRSRFIRLICNSMALIFLVFAYAGISWGTNLVSVQKNSNSVSLVFDISYSMLTEDAPGGLTRLQAASSYAKKLIERLEGSAFSVVLAKGDGVILIPQTEDMETVFMALGNLSPRMMSSAGSSLGKGIRSAIHSFPKNLSQMRNILVFTDGDETDGLLASSLADSIKSNIPVTIIGFGSERESEILAGDGKTPVKTALRAANLRESIAQALKKSGIRSMNERVNFAQYVDASEAGSAIKILRSIKKDSIFDTSSQAQVQPVNSASDGSTGSAGAANAAGITGITMEIQRVYRRGIFLALALLSIIAGAVGSECNIRFFRNKIKKAKASNKVASTLLLFSVFTLTSCSQNFKSGRRILQSSWAWHQQNYRKATVGFFQVLEDSGDEDKLADQYALYGLASTYMMQKEDESAILRFSQIAEDAPEDIRFASFYNLGVIAFRKGSYEEAGQYFHKALLIKPSNMNAKLNLELSYRHQEEKPVKANEQTANSIQQSSEQASSVSDALFSQIRENEENKWKSQSSQQSDSSVLDY